MFWFQRCNRYGSYRGDVYLFMAPFTPENFQQPSQIRKEYSSVYIDISLPSEFKNHPADCDSEFISIFACSDRGKYCTATNTTNSTFQVLSSVSIRVSGNTTCFQTSNLEAGWSWKKRGANRHAHSTAALIHGSI